MILKAAIVHILDSSVGIPVLSDQSMEVGPDFSDFLKAHIEKITESDDVKHCTFAEGSEVKELLQNCTPDNFVETSKQLAERLYDIMNANIDIPAADVAMTVFGCKGKDYLAFLKMNYKTSYTHQTRETDGGNSNEIILQRALLPGQGQRLSEAFVLDLSDGSLILRKNMRSTAKNASISPSSSSNAAPRSPRNPSSTSSPAPSIRLPKNITATRMHRKRWKSKTLSVMN